MCVALPVVSRSEPARLGPGTPRRCVVVDVFFITSDSNAVVVDNVVAFRTFLVLVIFPVAN